MDGNRLIRIVKPWLKKRPSMDKPQTSLILTFAAPNCRASGEGRKKEAIQKAREFERKKRKTTNAISKKD